MQRALVTLRRRSLRLPGYNYRSPGAYFITVCTKSWQPFFGNVVDSEMRFIQCGQIVQEEWLHTPVVRPGTAVDSFVVMPNHFHGIILRTDEQRTTSGVEGNPAHWQEDPHNRPCVPLRFP